jgi:hypothetical protein
MNIKVPYDKLGNVSDYEFVSFILDRGKHTIHRVDFINNGKEFQKFFNYEQQFITVPDDVYNECDSVIFFPFVRKTKNWGTKVIMWKNGEFSKFNGGYEYIRNIDKSPDMEKIDQWIKKGKLIKPSKKLVGTKNLIYFTLFGNKDYVKLLRMLIGTFAKHNYKNFDLLFITDSSTKEEIEKIEELKHHNLFFHLSDTIVNPVDASMQKIKIYDWKHISQYKNILFLDVDILVIGNVGTIFNSKKAKPNLFYSATHNKDMSMHDLVYHNLVDYTKDQKDNLVKKSITAFNAGQFFFKNTSSMKAHFENVDDFVDKWNGRYFFEQSFLNYYFNLLEMSNTSTFDDKFKFVSINENQTSNVFDKNTVFVHFMGNATNAEAKIEFIKNNYSMYI